MSKRATVLDLFCGAGGMSCGLEMAGFEVLGGVETDERAFATFLANHPRARAFEQTVDVRQLTGEAVFEATGLGSGELDVVAGGPPCQGFSTAGYRRTDDVRNSLIFEFVRLLGEIRPKFFVMENVVGLTSMTVDGREKVLGVLAKAFEEVGYATNIPADESAWKSLIVNAADHGVPQRRRRVLILGARGGQDQVPVLPAAKYRDPSTEGEGRSRRPHVTVEEALSDLPEPSRDEPVRLKSGVRLSAFAKLMRSADGTTHNHTPTRHQPHMIERMGAQANGTPLYSTWAHAWYRLVPDRAAPTVKENHNAPFVHHEAPRVVTPRECARLQSFPDDYKFLGPKSRVLVQVGNAVPPLLARAAGEALSQRLAGESRRPSSAAARDKKRQALEGLPVGG